MCVCVCACICDIVGTSPHCWQSEDTSSVPSEGCLRVQGVYYFYPEICENLLQEFGKCHPSFIHLQKSDKIIWKCSFAATNINNLQFCQLKCGRGAIFQVCNYLLTRQPRKYKSFQTFRFPLSRLQPGNLFCINSNYGATKYQIMLFWLNWTWFSFWWNLLLFNSVFRRSFW